LFALFERPQSFSIHDHVLFSWILLALNKLRPDPKPLGTSIDCRANLKTVILVEQYSVENVAFACSVLTNYSYNTNVPLLINFLTKPLNCFGIDG
jgi:hypothetical protein